MFLQVIPDFLFFSLNFLKAEPDNFGAMFLDYIKKK